MYFQILKQVFECFLLEFLTTLIFDRLLGYVSRVPTTLGLQRKRIVGDKKKNFKKIP